MFKVINKFKDIRKFRDGFIGKDVHVEPGKSILTKSPPKENEVWRVEKVEKKVKKNKKIMESDINDSSSS